jgi:hypothetical protein
MQTNAYIDGYNLYYRRLKGTPYKWLDVRRMVELLLPGYAVERVRYFTANVIPDPADPGQGVRQQTYLRALETLPNLTIHYGRFQLNRAWRRLAANPARSIEVLDPKEKGSDVNLATFLLWDSFADEYDSAFVVSNDSDLRTPIHVVRHRLGKKVGVGIPGTEGAIRKSALPADFHRRIRVGVLKGSQLPPVVRDAGGRRLVKPTGW